MWNKVLFNIQNIKAESDSSVLINFQHNSKYDGYSFWVTKKLVRSGSHSWEKSFSFTNEFKFKIFKNGKGRYNKMEKIDEKEITAEEMLAAWN